MRASILGGFCWALVASAASPSTSASPGDKPKLLVLELTASGGVSRDVAVALTEAVATDIGQAGYFQVISSKEVQSLLGIERQRQMVGCSNEGSCLAELAGALGAKLVVSGSVSKLGDTFQLSLQMLDSAKAQTLSRSIRIARSPEVLRSQLPFAIAEATGTPAPPLPSHILSYGLMGGGAALVVFAGVLGIQALTSESSLSAQLNAGVTQHAQLQSISYYQDQAGIIHNEKLAAIGAGIVGAGLIVTGVLINPSDTAAAGQSRVALVPNGLGAALAGRF